MSPEQPPCLLTIVTCTLGRRPEMLQALAQELALQAHPAVEWLVVGDGAPTETEKSLAHAAGALSVRYMPTPWSGKMRAQNIAANEARGQYIVIFDDDDLPAPGAIQAIVEQLQPLAAPAIGIAGWFAGNHTSATPTFPQPILADSVAIRSRHKIYGDLVEVFPTALVRRYPFILPEDESFMPEGTQWAQITRHGPLLYVPQVWKKGKYLPGGLTNRFVSLLIANPRGTMAYYAQTISHPGQTPKGALIAAMNLYCYTLFSNIPWAQRIKATGLGRLPMLAPAMALRLYYKITKRQSPLT